ncbi:hypothetical protein JZ751_025157, partial [Albula glossodonta]
EHAYPADELMPLTCRGRVRGQEPSRGDVDDALGKFSLTLIDTLDTLALLNKTVEFEAAVKKVLSDVKLDNDVVVSVFETNIRHTMAVCLREQGQHMLWYQDELLHMAKDLGLRLLPAFNTSSGLPYPRVNLRHGVRGPETRTGTETRNSNLVGTTINIHSGEWVRKDSGVGAGIDSYYEYLLKAYVLLGDDLFLQRFNTHYASIMKYISQPPLLLDVHIHKPLLPARTWMDSLLAFFPGLQVLKGDLRPAIEIHEMLYQAFTSDFRVHWAQHPLRPEFAESTYFLYKATRDPYYLEAGRSVLENLNRFARVPCGFAAMKDVRTGSHEDRMDSFFLAEMFKYLFLLFADEEDLPFDVEDYILTTEAHFLPLTLSTASHTTLPPAVNILGKSWMTQTLIGPAPTLAYCFLTQHSPTAFGNQSGLLLTTTDMMELSGQQLKEQLPPRAVQIISHPFFGRVVLTAGPAQFGMDLSKISIGVQGYLAMAEPYSGCTEQANADLLAGRIALLQRGQCMFAEKARHIQRAGAIGGIVIDDSEGSSSDTAPLFQMAGDGHSTDDIILPLLFLFHKEGNILLEALREHREVEVTAAFFKGKALASSMMESIVESQEEEDCPAEEVDNTVPNTPTPLTQSHLSTKDSGVEAASEKEAYKLGNGNGEGLEKGEEPVEMGGVTDSQSHDPMLIDWKEDIEAFC